VEAVRSFAELAVRGGATRLALLSGRGEPEAERAEQAVAATEADLTILRSTWFMQNFSEDYMLEHVLGGELRLPAGEVAHTVRGRRRHRRRGRRRPDRRPACGPAL
jgi:uncharacterized protein YbjT (DUF2867 family)